MNLGRVDIFEWWALAAYYFPSFAYCFLVTTIAASALFLARRKNKRPFKRRAIYWVLLLPSAVWFIYFLTTARTAFAITYLDSEDNREAEMAYRTLFDVSLNKAVKLALDESQSGNVRFYAACRIADLLAASDGQVRSNVLDLVANGSSFYTGFFGTNSLTCGFFTPNYQEGPFTVREIIDKRLRTIAEPDRK